MCTTESWLRLPVMGNMGFFNNAEILLLWRVVRVRLKEKNILTVFVLLFLFLWFHSSLMQPSIQAQVCIHCSSCPEVVSLCWWGSDRVRHRSQNTSSGWYWGVNTLLLYWQRFFKYLYFTMTIYFFDNFLLFTFSPHTQTQISLLLRLIFSYLMHCRLFKRLHPKC